MSSRLLLSNGSFPLFNSKLATIIPRRTLILETALTALASHFLLGTEARMADKMNNGELHNKNEDYTQLEKERTEERLNALRNTRPMKPNYEGHIPLWTSEKLLLFLISGIRSYYHPENGINIVQLGEATAITPMLNNLHKIMLSDPTGRRILQDKPDVKEDILKMDKLAMYPKNTFGYQFYTWCRRENVTPDTRAPIKYIDNPTHAFIFKRYRQCHDFYHALNNAPIVIEGEVTIKALEGANLGIPMAILGTLFAPWRLTSVQRKRLFDTYLPWAIESGLKSKPLINVYWEEILDKDINEIREELGLFPPPDLRTMRDERRKAIKELNSKYKKLHEENKNFL
ncbi:ubiquinone biosynthesis protein Coq4p, mitochondrial [Monosporozyma servazzii]